MGSTGISRLGECRVAVLAGWGFRSYLRVLECGSHTSLAGTEPQHLSVSMGEVEGQKGRVIGPDHRLLVSDFLGIERSSQAALWEQALTIVRPGLFLHPSKGQMSESPDASPSATWPGVTGHLKHGVSSHLLHQHHPPKNASVQKDYPRGSGHRAGVWVMLLTKPNWVPHGRGNQRRFPPMVPTPPPQPGCSPRDSMEKSLWGGSMRC